MGITRVVDPEEEVLPTAGEVGITRIRAVEMVVEVCILFCELIWVSDCACVVAVVSYCGIRGVNENIG